MTAKKKPGPKPSSVHRVFNLASPVQKGTDVKALQRAVNEQYEHFKVDRRITVDGEFGSQSMFAIHQIALCMGAGRKNLAALKNKRVSLSVQRLVREKRDKTSWEKAATNLRAPYRRKLRKRYALTPAKMVLEWCRKQEGVSESPAGSNWGPKVSEWIQFTGYSGPVYWCGCFAAYALIKVGGAKVPSVIRFGYAPYITADAQAGRNGLRAVSAENARPGRTVLTYWGGQHIGVLATEVDGNGNFKAWEGNTGKSGSQSNGGSVELQSRNVSDVDCFAEVTF